jgi:hypothetical protein
MGEDFTEKSKERLRIEPDIYAQSVISQQHVLTGKGSPSESQTQRTLLVQVVKVREEMSQ